MTKYNIYNFDINATDYHKFQGTLTIEDGKFEADLINPTFQVLFLDALKEKKPKTLEELLTPPNNPFNLQIIYEVDKEGNEIRGDGNIDFDEEGEE
tara:strand:- start:10423 stop:10710 length:288 start_codon:yes stop_codon:yes gene_type:complete